jgi:hypothetical protein
MFRFLPQVLSAVHTVAPSRCPTARQSRSPSERPSPLRHLAAAHSASASVTGSTTTSKLCSNARARPQSRPDAPIRCATSDQFAALQQLSSSKAAIVAAATTAVVLLGVGGVTAIRIATNSTHQPEGDASQSTAAAGIVVTNPLPTTQSTNSLGTVVPIVSASTSLVDSLVAERWHVVGSVTRAVAQDAQGVYTQTEAPDSGYYIGYGVDKIVLCPARICEIALPGKEPAFAAFERLTAVIGGATLQGTVSTVLLPDDPNPCDPVQLTAQATRQPDGSYQGTFTHTPAHLYVATQAPISACFYHEVVVTFTMFPLP